MSQNEIVSETNYYPFGLAHKGYNEHVNSTNLGEQFKFNGKELNDEMDLGWYDFGARNYDASLGRWFNVDPLAEMMRRHSPYNYAFDNPVYWVDPDGMAPCPNGDCLDIIGPLTKEQTTTQATNNAQGSHISTSDSGQRFYGYKAEGQVEGESGQIAGSISGFSAGYDGTAEGGGVHGETSIYGVSVEGEAQLGSKDNNIGIKGEGTAFKAEASGDAGFYTGENGKFGAELGVEAGAYALEGSITPSVTIGAVNIGFTVGASLGSAHAGARVAGTLNTQTNKFEATGNLHLGLGAGFKVGFSISNDDQKVNKQNR